MKYKIGDRVRIKSIDWYNENKSKSHGTVVCDGRYFDYNMREWCGKTLTIQAIGIDFYLMEEDNLGYEFTNEMIEGLVEEDIIDIDDFQDDNEIIDIIDEYVHRLKGNECQINLPNGYIFKDENGNVIKATKIVLEKKKKEYPKTYCECKDILGLWDIDDTERGYYKTDLIDKLQMLLICRDAYWKIAGEKMGLGKPWKPNWGKGACYTICCNTNQIVIGTDKFRNSILAFPTAEMRDAFYENFKEEIEICKELL